MLLQRFFEEARDVIQGTDRWPRKCCQIEWGQEALYVAWPECWVWWTMVDRRIQSTAPHGKGN